MVAFPMKGTTLEPVRVTAGERADAAAIDMAGEAMPLRPSDVVIVLMSTLAALCLFAAGAWAPGSWESIIVYSTLAAGPLLIRWWGSKCGGNRRRMFDFLGAFWLLPTMVLGHCYLGPLVDSLNPRLMDGYLARADLKLFGLNPSVALEAVVPPWLTEIFLLCYYTYFLWPVALGLILWARARRPVFDEYIFALALFFAANFCLYILVPAIGPRFYLANEFSGPLKGVWLTPLLDAGMRSTSFMRDCFPSGHTGATLVVLAYAFLHARKFFYVMLPFASGLIAATLVCRFHYAIDLLCAVPLMLVVVSTASFVARRPLAEAFRRQALAMRQLLRA